MANSMSIVNYCQFVNYEYNGTSWGQLLEMWGKNLTISDLIAFSRDVLGCLKWLIQFCYFSQQKGWSGSPLCNKHLQKKPQIQDNLGIHISGCITERNLLIKLH